MRSQVNVSELATLTGLDRKTVTQYIRLLDPTGWCADPVTGVRTKRRGPRN
ncbi:MAG: hypothetical protein LBL01_03440 [Bifidobacteriaceae bacterium]|nr:hypothetical protein [Bifidobacteriaceae bacterium]